MQKKSLGNLISRSKSLNEFADLVRALRDILGDIAFDKILPEGLPDDLSKSIKDEATFLRIWLEAAFFNTQAGRAILVSPTARAIVERARSQVSILKALETIAVSPQFKPLHRMLLVARANNIDFQSSRMRIVDSDLTPYQAKTQCQWTGTLAEFRTGSIVTGPADPKGYFSIYFPTEKRDLRGDFSVTRITCDYQV